MADIRTILIGMLVWLVFVIFTAAERSWVFYLSATFLLFGASVAFLFFAIREVAMRYEAALDALPCALIMLDDCNKLTYFNRCAEAMLGVDRRSMLRRDISVPSLNYAHDSKTYAYLNGRSRLIRGQGIRGEGLRPEGYLITVSPEDDEIEAQLDTTLLLRDMKSAYVHYSLCAEVLSDCFWQHSESLKDIAAIATRAANDEDCRLLSDLLQELITLCCINGTKQMEMYNHAVKNLREGNNLIQGAISYADSSGSSG